MVTLRSDADGDENTLRKKTHEQDTTSLIISCRFLSVAQRMRKQVDHICASSTPAV